MILLCLWPVVIYIPVCLSCSYSQLKMGGGLCGCSEPCSWQSCLWCCCRTGARGKKFPAATEICRLRWNWFYLILLAPVISISYNSIISSFHQFVTNPTAEQLNGTWKEDKIDAELGLSEKFYHVAISSFSIGEFLGAMMGGIFASRIPFWYSTLASLLFHSVAFLIYAIAMDGWIVIAAQLLSGMFVGQQSVISLTYIGVKYQHYVEVLDPKERMKEERKITRVKDTLFAFYNVSASCGTLFGLGTAVIFAQFNIDLFRSIAWFNLILGIGYICLLIAMFRGESKCHCENHCRKCKRSLPVWSRFKETVTCSKVSLILIVGSLILAQGSITANLIVYEELFNPILSDSFGFTIKQTSYFFVLLLPAFVGGSCMVILMQKLKMNSRIIAIFGILCSVIGLTLMADWQSIPHDPCTDFSVYYHPEVANYLSDSLEPCLTSPSDCQWPQNGGSIRNISAVENKSHLQYVEMTEFIIHTQGWNRVLNATVYRMAMNICESLTESELHCHWIPKSVLNGKLCEACPAICRGTGHTLNFVQFTIGALIFRTSLPISTIASMIVLSDSVSKDYQSIAMGLAYASTGVFKSVTPLIVGTAYERVQKRTFLAMSIMIAAQIPLILILVLLYHKLGQLRNQHMQVSDTKPLPDSTRDSDQDSASDMEDGTEVSELLSTDRTPLEGSGN